MPEVAVAETEHIEPGRAAARLSQAARKLRRARRGRSQMASSGGSSEAELLRSFKTLAVARQDPAAAVYEVRLNRPALRNALSPEAFADIPRAMALLDRLPVARAVVLSAAGPHFCAGIELGEPGNPLAAPPGTDPVAAADGLRRAILDMQAALTAVELCRKPVIAAVHGACVGGGVDLVGPRRQGAGTEAAGAGRGRRPAPRERRSGTSGAGPELASSARAGAGTATGGDGGRRGGAGTEAGRRAGARRGPPELT